MFFLVPLVRFLLKVILALISSLFVCKIELKSFSHFQAKNLFFFFNNFGGTTLKYLEIYFNVLPILSSGSFMEYGDIYTMKTWNPLNYILKGWTLQNTSIIMCKRDLRWPCEPFLVAHKKFVDPCFIQLNQFLKK